MELSAPLNPPLLSPPQHPDGASAVSSDEGRVGRVPGSHPGPVSQRQAAAHHQVSGFADRHQGGWPEPGHCQPGAQPGPAGPLPQGAGITHHQSPCQGPHLVSEASAGQTLSGTGWRGEGGAPPGEITGRSSLLVYASGHSTRDSTNHLALLVF